MKQILQNLSDGETILAEVPCPKGEEGRLLIASRSSLVSAGTERMLVNFGQANLIDKARQQPDKVKMVLDKVKADGLLTTIDAVRSRLDQPLPLGYCNAGIVIESGVAGFSVGDRVASNGNHAEVVSVPKNLCARIPEEVDYETASFTVLAAVGLQGIRLARPTLGETVVVTGLGLIGLLIVQMLRSNGCRVLGIDRDSVRCAKAGNFGADVVDLSKGEDPVSVARVFSRGRGVDAVIIAASTPSDEVMHQAAEMCRQRGRIVLVGVVGLNLRREDFYQKEISFQVSASYGPGRYDPLYEERGQDYPLGFVRWTEQRNFEAVLDMMASGTLDVKSLITHRCSIEESVQAYSKLNDPQTLGIVLNYPETQLTPIQQRQVTLDDRDGIYSAAQPVVGFIGAGNYASRILIPAFRAAGAGLECVVSAGGVSGVHHGKKAGFRKTSTDADTIWKDPGINTVVIATRHDSHASLVMDAIKSGKHVFVEKPLCLTLQELDDIDRTCMRARENRGLDSTLSRDNAVGLLMVGFNRRFAPLVAKMKKLKSSVDEPCAVIVTVNAGEIPASHWTQDPAIGGGRIIGECCHFIDLMRFLVGSGITGYQATTIGNLPENEVRQDKVSITLNFADGSFGAIHYLANGGRVFPKERVEIFCGGAVLQLDNYRSLRGYGWRGFGSTRLWRQDKGQKECAKAFIEAVENGKPAPIPYEEIIEVSRVSIELANSLS